MALDRPARVDLDLYFEAYQDRFHATDNPAGRFPMNMAENKLLWPLLEAKIQSIVQQQPVPDWVPGYENPLGADSFREALAGYMSEWLIGRSIEKDTLGCSAGLTSVIELTALSLADPGDTVVIPAPAYPVYTSDIGVVAGLRRYDLPYAEPLTTMRSALYLDPAQLDAAKAEIEAGGSRFRILILTAPDNPTGGVYTAANVAQIADWCIAQEIHLVVNEIYGLSRIDTSHPEIAADYSNPGPWVSFGQLMAERQSPFLHLWYAFSKDLGISGWRIGVVHTYNQAFLRAYSNGNLTRMVSNYTQWVLQEVLKDQTFMADYLQRNQVAITESYAIAASTLRELGLDYYPARGSLFLWGDFSGLLDAKNEAAEHQLWLDIYHETGILLTPADGFGHREHGWFRMVITYLGPDDQKIAMEKLKKYVLQKQHNV